MLVRIIIMPVVSETRMTTHTVLQSLATALITSHINDKRYRPRQWCRLAKAPAQKMKNNINTVALMHPFDMGASRKQT